jgi:large subunit ribosomal protein L43
MPAHAPCGLHLQRAHVPRLRGPCVALSTRMHVRTHARTPVCQVLARRGGHAPLARAGDGRSKPVCVKNLGPDEILEHIAWLRNSHGRGQEYQVVRARHLSRHASVQGRWSVDTFAPALRLENERRLSAAERATSF